MSSRFRLATCAAFLLHIAGHYGGTHARLMSRAEIREKQAAFLIPQMVTESHSDNPATFKNITFSDPRASGMSNLPLRVELGSFMIFSICSVLG